MYLWVHNIKLFCNIFNYSFYKIHKTSCDLLVGFLVSYSLSKKIEFNVFTLICKVQSLSSNNWSNFSQSVQKARPFYSAGNEDFHSLNRLVVIRNLWLISL
jgi:hypothetical protein